ncbi:MAG: methyltransferase domain-containing protein [Clostridiales bacterium]|nr:methyltransferase domain-containing protein [Clostridiales bacterium]
MPNKASLFICPVCKGILQENEKSYVCENNHTFDKAKSSYVNLLMSNASHAHGDSKEMVASRHRFLSSDKYKPLMESTVDMAKKYFTFGNALDAGAGEGYYTSHIYTALNSNGVLDAMYGIDVSKFALMQATKASPNVKYAVASIFNLPFDDSSFSIIFNLFAPLSSEEFARVLCDDGILIRLLPLENHLIELKRVIYNEAYLNDPPESKINSFSLIDYKEIKYSMNVEKELLPDLFAMTPYYRKTSAQDSAKLHDISSMDITVHTALQVFRKNNR